MLEPCPPANTLQVPGTLGFPSRTALRQLPGPEQASRAQPGCECVQGRNARVAGELKHVVWGVSTRAHKPPHNERQSWGGKWRGPGQGPAPEDRSPHEAELPSQNCKESKCS